MIRHAPCVALAMTALLGACGHSPPTRFFTLDPVTARSPGDGTAVAPVQLDAVHIPAALDRPELVTQTGPDQLSIDEQDQWAAPLGQVMRKVLAEDLLARLPAGAFVLPDAPRSPEVRALIVTVLALKVDPGGTVDLQANWTLLAGSAARTVLSRNARLTASGAGAGPAARAAAISQALGQLADQIAAGIRAA